MKFEPGEKYKNRWGDIYTFVKYDTDAPKGSQAVFVDAHGSPVLRRIDGRFNKNAVSKNDIFGE